MRFFKGMVKLFIPTNLPLFLAVGRQRPALMATASALAIFLGKLTINGSGPAANSSFDTVLEQSAIASLVATSTLNRVVRISMGSCHLLGAVLYNVRTSRAAIDNNAGLLSTISEARLPKRRFTRLCHCWHVQIDSMPIVHQGSHKSPTLYLLCCLGQHERPMQVCL